MGLTMATLLSKGLDIQREYAQKRKRALNKRDEEKITLVTETITRLAKRSNVMLDGLAARDRAGRAGWEVVYELLITHLQGCDLTINLEAENWFGGRNTYQTYATTYQKNMDNKGGKAVLKTQKDSTGKITEDADSRLYADERVTLPDNWRSASLLHPQRRRLAKAMSTTGGKAVTELKKVDLGNDQEGFEIENRRFNPNAKQVFAALNYGRRMHGASVNYGYSHIVLNPRLKRNALYFPGDTFMVAMAKNSVDRQCTFETLGAVLAYCMDGMANGIWDAGIKHKLCEDTDDAFDLLEAHIFEQVRIDRDVQELALSRRKKDGSEIPAERWELVKTNAREWGRRNNIRVMMLSA